MAGKYRSFRTDTLTNQETEGLHPIDRDILHFQVVASNIAGILERSVAKIARMCGGGTTTADVEASLRRLEARGLVQWWPELETVWAVKSAGDQARGPKAWVAVANVVEVLPISVRSAFSERYAERYAKAGHSLPDGDPNGAADRVSRTERQPGNREQGKGNRAQESRGGAARVSKPKAQAVDPPKTKADREADLRHGLALFRELVLHDAECRPTPPGREQLGPLIVGDRTALSLLEQGATAHEMHTVAKALARRISSGELPPDMWGGLSFSWPYPALRDGLPVAGRSKPGLAPSTGPRIESAEDAEAYAKAHGGRLPDSWQWQQDGRGGARAVRAGGAA